MLFLSTFLLVLVAPQVHSTVKWQPNMKSFSHAIKQASCKPGVEEVVFEHSTGPGVLTEQWFTGSGCMTNATRVRIYIDGETTASLDFNLHLAHGIGFTDEKTQLREAESENDVFWMSEKERVDPQAPWGTRRTGHLASGGGIYNTYRIPFQKSIKVSFIPAEQGAYWYIVRGVENYPVILGDLELPQNARLKLYKLENIKLQPYEYTVLANIHQGSGALFQVTLATQSVNYHYLEACFRAMVDNGQTQYLSSGTEDFFLSAYYYDKGLYHTDHAGLTAKQLPGTMSAYKFFESDPVLFSKSFKLLWRSGEKVDNECWGMKRRGCYRKDGKVFCKDVQEQEMLRYMEDRNKPTAENGGGLQVTQASIYTWVYEW